VIRIRDCAFRGIAHHRCAGVAGEKRRYVLRCGARKAVRRRAYIGLCYSARSPACLLAGRSAEVDLHSGRTHVVFRVTRLTGRSRRSSSQTCMRRIEVARTRLPMTKICCCAMFGFAYSLKFVTTWCCCVVLCLRDAVTRPSVNRLFFAQKTVIDPSIRNPISLSCCHIVFNYQ